MNAAEREMLMAALDHAEELTQLRGENERLRKALDRIEGVATQAGFKAKHIQVVRLMDEIREIVWSVTGRAASEGAM